MDSSDAGRLSIRRGELLALLSLTMALSALSIDLMLPAFGEMRASFGMDPDSPEMAATVTALFIGQASAQVFYGPISDRFGRRPALFAGITLYVLGAAGSALAPSFGFLLASRLVWGVGAAGPRVVSLAIVRDVYRGDRMARAMSLLMAIFILVPVMAPSLGAAIILVFPWQAVFWFCVLYAGGIAAWAGWRLPETLAEPHRIPLSFHRVRRATLTVVSHGPTMAYALAMTLLFGVFSSYLGSSQLIIDDVFGLDDMFPIIFGGLAVLMGIANLANASIVERIGAGRIVEWVTTAYVAAGAGFVAVSAASGGSPGFWSYTALLAVLLMMNSLLVPNLSTLAMDPMGAVAGTASGVIGTLQIGGGALLGSLIDRAYDNTVTPLAVGFLAAGVLSWLVVRWAARRP